MTKFLVLILSLLTISTFAQKNEIYLNDDLIEISYEEFKSLNTPRLYYDL